MARQRGDAAPPDPLEMLGCLGSGGFGEVYLARRGGREVAVKVLHHGLDPRSQAVQRLRDEARLLALLDHPGILAIDELVLLEGRVALITEYVDGADLEDLLPPRGDILPAAGVDALQQVATALQAAYTTIDPRGRPLRLLHRDIKPANLRVARDGRVKLLDFGIAKATGVTREARTQGSSVLGSFAYMAPERFDPRQDDGPAGDVYSLGCVLFEVLSGGAMLLEGYELRALFGLAMNQPARDEVIARRVDTLRVPDAARGLLTEMLAWDPSARPDLADAADRLDGVAAHLPGERLVPWCRGRSWPDVPSTPGALTGRTIDTDRSDPAAVPAVPTQETLALHESLTPAPRVDRQTRTTEGQVPVAPLSPPQRQPSSRRAPLAVAVAGGAVALLVFGLGLGALGGAALGVRGSGAATSAPATGPVPEPSSVVPAPSDPEIPQTEPRDALPDTPVPGPTPRPAEGTASDGPPVAPDPAPQALAQGTPSGADASGVCDDLVALEAPARDGALSPAQRLCLDELIARAPALTQRRNAGRVVLADAQTRCERDGLCGDWERRMPEFLEHLDQSDPDLVRVWATYLYRTAEGDPRRLRQVDRWAEVALRNAAQWSGAEHTTKRLGLLELRSRAVYGLSVAAPDSETVRLEARDRAVEWAAYLRQIGKDAAPAMALCASAAGEEACGSRVTTEAVKMSVRVLSRPADALIYVDGQEVGKTPRQVPLTLGTHQLELVLGEARTAQVVEVGQGKPTGWTWVVEDGTWTGSL